MISTISAYQISAEDFFETLRRRKVDLLLDIRLKNHSQLCGFTKKGDLPYLTRAICGAQYLHDALFAPDGELLDQYLGHWIPFSEYAAGYLDRLQQADTAVVFRERYGGFGNVCLLGTATKKRRSHSEVLKAHLEGRDFCAER